MFTTHKLLKLYGTGLDNVLGLQSFKLLDFFKFAYHVTGDRIVIFKQYDYRNTL